MANRTDIDAASVHGTNPQNLVEKILRMKIYAATYWKQHCFGLTAESLVDKAIELNYVGGTFGGQRKPTEFICLVLKLLQLQPDKEIIVEFIRNEDYKYVRVLGAFYLRLVGRPKEVYDYLEPLYNDYRKLRQRQLDGTFSLTHMDEVIDQMLQGDYLFDIALPRLPNRHAMERIGQLEPRISMLEADFDEEALEAEAAEARKAAEALEKEMLREAGDKHKRARSPDRGRDKKRRSRSRSRSRERRREADRGRDRDEDRDRSRHKARERDVEFGDRKRRRSRSRDREPDKRRDKDREGDWRKAEAGDGQGGDLSDVAANNAMRAKLGLPPLRT